MKKTFLLSLFLTLALALAAGAGWFAGQRQQPSHRAADGGGSSGRQAKFYQSPMHPWIKSDQPGKCTICGMDLVPVYDEAELGSAAGMSDAHAMPDNNSAAAATGTGLLKLSANSVRVAGIRAEPVRRGALAKTLEVSGSVDDDETRHRFISAFSSGRVEKLYVRYVGAEVTAGQPLATFYAPEVQVAQGELLLAMKAGGVNANGAREKLRRLGLSDAQIAAVEKRGSADRDVEILAPLGGSVIERNVYEGQWVNYGDKLFTLADFSIMWFQFDAYERDLPWLKVGQPVAVTTDAVPGRVFNAQITFIDPNLNELTRSTKVRVEIPNADRALAHRVYARGRVAVGAGDGENHTLLVPRSAVLQAGERAMAYVEREPGQYEPRVVKLGRVGDRDYEVLDGLREGERVVTAGNLLLDAQAQLGREVASSEHTH